MTQQAIKRGVLQSFNASSYTANVLILEATSYVLSNVPIAANVDGTSALSGSTCAVLFLDEQNPLDAVILAVYGRAPYPTPGRSAFMPPQALLNAVNIDKGAIKTCSISGVPAGALALYLQASMHSSSLGAWVGIAPHSGNAGSYLVLGDTSVANRTIHGSGVVPISPNGTIDVKANAGNCTVTLLAYGYIV